MVQRKNWVQDALFPLIALLLGTSFSLVLAEFAIRLLAPQTLVSDIIEADAEVDYRLRPNARGRMVSPEFSVEIKVNSLGFRVQEISQTKQPGVRRVLFLGDSFVFGHGLVEEETLPYLVGRELQRRQIGTFEVVNGGVYGYCTANELELFMKYGLPLRPDIVVTLVMFHDMFENLAWYELTSDGQLQRKQRTSPYIKARRITRHIPGSAWLRERSHLFKFVGMRVLPTLRAGGGSTQDVKPRVTVGESPPPVRVTVALLNKLAEIAKENGAKPVLLTLGGGSSASTLLLHEQLMSAALEAGFSDTLALHPILTTYQGAESLFFPQDRHWTSAATRFVAPAVTDVIARVSAQP